jgi:hypothetical protein
MAQRRCSNETWARVINLFTCRVVLPARILPLGLKDSIVGRARFEFESEDSQPDEFEI